MNKPILIEDLGYFYLTETSKQKRRIGIFECGYCGEHFKTSIQNVKSENTKSCGCHRTPRLKSEKSKTNNPIYGVWSDIRQRCRNKNNKFYKDYGGRGITICERWELAENFIEDMYPSYKKGLSIDRIDSNGNYEPSNCRWSTPLVQSRNTRRLNCKNTSGYRGVSYDKERQKWSAKIRVNYKNITLGRYNTPLEAAIAYDSYVINNNLEHTTNGVTK